MCLLIWTVFSGERWGPWASCFKWLSIMLTLISVYIFFVYFIYLSKTKKYKGKLQDITTQSPKLFKLYALLQLQRRVSIYWLLSIHVTYSINWIFPNQQLNIINIMYRETKPFVISVWVEGPRLFNFKHHFSTSKVILQQTRKRLLCFLNICW